MPKVKNISMNPQDATFYSFTGDSYQPKLKETLKFRDQQEFIIVKTELIDSDLKDLEDRLVQEKLHGRAIIFQQFKPFRKDFSKLSLLKRYEGAWKFYDFQNLDKHSLDAIYDLLQAQHEERSQKIRQGQKKSKKPIGNPQLKKKKNSANRGRTLAAMLDKNNIEIKRAIYDLRKNKEYSFGKITEVLNNDDQYTDLCRGDEFYRTSVKRFYDDTEKMITAFEGASVPLDLNIKKIKNKEIITVPDLELDARFEHTITFSIQNSSNIDFQIVIQDIEEDDVFRKDYAANTQAIKIDLDKYNLLAGFHYLSIFPLHPDMQEQAILAKRIILRPSLYRAFQDLIK